MRGRPGLLTGHQGGPWALRVAAEGSGLRDFLLQLTGLLVSLHLAELTASPAADGPAREDGNPVGPRATFSIKGMKIEAQAKAKAKATRPSRAHPAKPKGCQQHPKIRNYNLKD